MAVIDPEDLNVRPVLDWRQFIYRVDHIKDDGDSIFVVLADQAYVGVRAESFDCAEPFVRYLAILEVREPVVKSGGVKG